MDLLWESVIKFLEQLDKLFRHGVESLPRA